MKMMVGLLISILIILTVNLFWPTAQINKEKDAFPRKIVSSTQVVSEGNKFETTGKPQTNVESNHHIIGDETARMASEYNLLEKERKDLERQLSHLKHKMWRLKFPVKQAKEINEIMSNAYKLIKNPGLLGSFSDIKGIRNELDKISFASEKLEYLNTMISEYREKDTTENQ